MMKITIGAIAKSLTKIGVPKVDAKKIASEVQARYEEE